MELLTLRSVYILIGARKFWNEHCYHGPLDKVILSIQVVAILVATNGYVDS